MLRQRMLGGDLPDSGRNGQGLAGLETNARLRLTPQKVQRGSRHDGTQTGVHEQHLQGCSLS